MRKPSSISIPINELIKPVSRSMEGHKKGKYGGNQVFQTSQNIWKTTKEGAN